MSTLQEQITAEMSAAIHAWFDERLQRTDLKQSIERTTLQVGIFNDFLLDYKPGRATADDIDLGLDVDDVRPSTSARLDDAQMRAWVVPQLTAVVQARLAPLVDTPMIDYRFTCRGKFQTAQGKLHLTLLEHVNEAKRKDLLARIHAYVEQELTHGSAPTLPLETFFLAQHLLDAQLFPQPDVAWTIAQYERIQALNKAQPDTLAQHRHDIIRAITQWAENVFLPQFYDRTVSAYRATQYALKAGAAPGTDADADAQALQPIDLLLYGAVMILRHDASYAKAKGLKFLEIAQELGSERAGRMLREGSGTFSEAAIHLKNTQLECRANDVFATLTISISEEGESAYAQALACITHLLQNGFPKSYQIKLKSQVKQYLPVKGLAKSDTHRFFANALAYPGLHGALEDYARAAIERFEFYADTEGEKNCMPGSYAAFGLGLIDVRYFPLVQHYMAQVDEEHQSVQDAFTAALVAQHGVTPESIAVLVACLRVCTDNVKLKLQADFEQEENLACLYQQLQELDSYLVEHVLYAIWGKPEKLAALARKAEGRRKELLLALIAAAATSAA